MSTFTITSDLAGVTKKTKDTISIQPHNQYIGTELNDERFRELYVCYCNLMLEQYADDLQQCADGQTSEGKTMSNDEIFNLWDNNKITCGEAAEMARADERAKVIREINHYIELNGENGQLEISISELEECFSK